LSWLLLLVLSLATFRLTRLAVRDDFPPIAWVRDKIRFYKAVYLGDDEDGEEVFKYRWWGELITCHWCASAYVALALVELSNIFVSIPLPVVTWLAVWASGAVLADRLM
jgi:hypothetical protein